MVQGKRFTKIKDKGTKLEIRWEQPVGGNYDANQCDLKSAISPHPDFRSAMQDLVTYWQQMLDLDERYAQDVKLHSLQISWKDRQISGAILTGAKPVSSTQNPAVFSTPSGASLPAGADEAIRKVCQEAALYLEGKNGEEDLFDDPDEGQTVEAEAEIETTATAQLEPANA